jgi:hypothetical protein
MNETDTRCRVYDPDDLYTMGRAFDKAVRGLSEQSKAEPNIRRHLALCIIRLFDEGERAPLHLAIIASSIVAGRKRISQEHSSRSYPAISVLFPSDTDGQPVAA